MTSEKSDHALLHRGEASGVGGEGREQLKLSRPCGVAKAVDRPDEEIADESDNYEG